jgi:ADP-ribosylglycohydrolase
MGQREMYNSLVALAVGDATGENMMKILPQLAAIQYKAGNVAGERGLQSDSEEIFWPWTDDASMAIVVYRHLRKHGTIIQHELALEFARQAKLDPQRGYGKGTQRLLYNYLYDSENWRELSEHSWGTEPMSGSVGNGSAMRDSIIGPYFGRDYQRVIKEARASAEVTHFSFPAICGSIAVAVAAAVATEFEEEPDKDSSFWFYTLLDTPKGEMRDRLNLVRDLEKENATNWQIVGQVGNGSQVTALDTVPFAIWQAHQALVKKMTFEATMQSIIEVGGDTDTVAAMVGGIIGNRIQPTQEWINRTEPLPKDIL